MSGASIKLDILSDPICPWCYIGKANLDAALLERPNHPFLIEWHPFRLNPDMPPGGMDRRRYLEAKFGSREGAAAAYARVFDAARAAGLDIAWDRIDRTPNTLDAHRLIHWAGVEGRQTAAVSALFDAYLQQGKDIGDRDVLGDLAARIEMDRAVVLRLLATSADLDDIEARDAHARARGVTGVPTFVVDGRHVVVGAQTPDLWRQVIDELAAS